MTPAAEQSRAAATPTLQPAEAKAGGGMAPGNNSNSSRETKKKQQQLMDTGMKQNQKQQQQPQQPQQPQQQQNEAAAEATLAQATAGLIASAAAAAAAAHTEESDSETVSQNLLGGKAVDEKETPSPGEDDLSNIRVLMPERWERDMETEGFCVAQVEGVEVSPQEHDGCVTGEWLNNFADLNSEDRDARYDSSRWIGDVDRRCFLGRMIAEVGRQVIANPGWKRTTVRPDVLRKGKCGMSALLTLPGADLQSPHLDGTELSLIFCFTPGYPVGIFPGSHMRSGAKESLFVGQAYEVLMFRRGVFHFGEAYPGCSWPTIPSNAVKLGPNVRRGAHSYVDRSSDVPVYTLTEFTVEYAARRRSRRLEGEDVANLLGVDYNVIFDGGLAMLGSEVVILQSSVTEEKVEVGVMETGALKTVPRAELQPVTKAGIPMKGNFVTRFYGPKSGLMDTGIKLQVFGGADVLYPDKTSGLVCTGMPVLLKEDYENLPMAHGEVLRLGYVLRTNGGQTQGLVFLQKSSGFEGWDFQVLQLPLGRGSEALLVRDEKFMALHPRGSSSSSRSSQGRQIALTQADLEKEKRSLMAFRYAFSQAMGVIIQRTRDAAKMTVAQISRVGAGGGGKGGALTTKTLQRGMAREKTRAKSVSGHKRQREEKVAAEEEKAKQAKLEEHAEKMKYAEKLRLIELKAKHAEEKARSLERAIGGATPARGATEEHVKQAVLLKEKELRAELAEAERQKEAKVCEELRRQLEQQGKERLQLTVESAEERGRRIAAEHFTALLGEKDERHTSDLKQAFACNADLAKEQLSRQGAHMALMFNMYSQFTSLAAGRSGQGENSAAHEGMVACTQHLLSNTEQGGQKGKLKELMAPPAVPGKRTPDKPPQKKMRADEVRAFLSACQKAAKQLAADLKSENVDTVVAAEIELNIHKEIVSGGVDPEEGEEGKSEKILELFHSMAEK
ncbi:hypothetical protein CYMTET_44052 [Cymbomonas tetramitiformis]|uniref:Uncharacterized protein n=1 Tax=Cymbomonas tetramitiformis TaxID=36881 RepID=A0AAE0C292_9CHLO|nr:hypothetical protein CYMTET_44052 [Cymbomonas tetramitiformis]